MTPHAMAAAVEQARFALLRQGRWDELRDTERVTRVELLQAAMAHAGVTGEIERLRAEADRAEALGLVLADHEARAAAQREEHDAQLVGLDDALRAVRAELAAAHRELAAAQVRAEAAEAVVRAVQAAVVPAGPAPSSVAEPSAADAGRETARRVVTPRPRGRLLSRVAPR